MHLSTLGLDNIRSPWVFILIILILNTDYGCHYTKLPYITRGQVFVMGFGQNWKDASKLLWSANPFRLILKPVSILCHKCLMALPLLAHQKM
jgi:hypothetical protein